MLAMENPMAGRLRDLRLADQVLKSVFRPPEMKQVGGKVVKTYTGGLASFVGADGAVHSTFYPTADSGRLTSSRPPMQNMSGKREADYARILGELYGDPIRSVIVPRPCPDDPRVLLEADFGGAELLLLATMSRDPVMIDHCLRGLLPESDPNYFDIHANTCVNSYRLDCPPTKAGLASIGKKHLRVGAKATIFTRNYGGSAETIYRKIREEGTDVSLNDVVNMLEAIDATYPASKLYQVACGERVDAPGWIASCYGRYRRTWSGGPDMVPSNELRRIFSNFVMQAGVADAMNKGLRNLFKHPRKRELDYDIVLQIHDAVMLDLPARNLAIVYDEIIPECLEQKVTFRSCNLDGIPYADSPVYHFGVDKKACLRWGMPLTWDDCDRLQIDRRFGVAA
jgi:DNA polymerase-1